MDLRILRRLAFGFSLLYAVLLWSVVSANDTTEEETRPKRTRPAIIHRPLSQINLPLIVMKENFENGTERWQPMDAAAWKEVQQDGNTFYSMFKDSEYKPPVRSPSNFALLKDITVTDFTLDLQMRSTQEIYGHQDLCLFFGYQDPSHFYYVHLGREADEHANSIFLVDGKPRVSIAAERTTGTDWSKTWHHIRIKRDTKSGSILVYFDDMKTPVMKTTDNSFLHGRIGIGSFDDTGDFDDIRLIGKRKQP